MGRRDSPVLVLLTIGADQGSLAVIASALAWFTERAFEFQLFPL